MVAIKQIDGVVLLLIAVAAVAAVAAVVVVVSFFLRHQHHVQQMYGKHSKERGSNLAAAGRLGYESS